MNVIPARPATVPEALKLMCTGWGSIFIVILVMMVFVFILNRLFRKKEKR